MMVAVAVAVVVVAVVVFDITYGIHSKDFQYKRGFKDGKDDFKKGCRGKYQKYYMQGRQRGDISTYKSSYIDGYNIASHRS